jgi:hypothetical protein
MKTKFPLYHGTQCKAIPNILKYGLLVETENLVHRESVQDEEHDPDMKEKRAFDRGIYLTDDLEGALRYAFDASKDIPPEWIGNRHIEEETDADYDNTCVLQVNCFGKGAKVGLDGYGDLMTNKDIPAHCIKPLYRKDVEKKLGSNYEDLYVDM